MTGRLRTGHVLYPRIISVTTDSDRAFPVSFTATDEAGNTHVVQMSAIDAVRLAQRLSEAGRLVHAARKAAQ